MKNKRVIEAQDGTANLDSFYAAIASEAIPDDVIVDQLAITQDELDRARTYAKDRGFSRIPPEFIAQMMRDFIGMASSAQTPGTDTQRGNTVPKYERVKSLRTQVTTLCNKYAMMTGTEFKEVHLQWMRQGGMPQNKATEADLMRKKEWVLRKIKEYEERR